MNYINHLLSNTMINHNLPTGGLWRIQHSFIIQPRAYVHCTIVHVFLSLEIPKQMGGGGWQGKDDIEDGRISGKWLPGLYLIMLASLMARSMTSISKMDSCRSITNL